METAAGYRLVQPPPWRDPPGDFATLMHSWNQLSVGMNAVNRSMGMPDAYPFVFNAAVRQKLDLVHRRIREYETAAG